MQLSKQLPSNGDRNKYGNAVQTKRNLSPSHADPKVARDRLAEPLRAHKLDQAPRLLPQQEHKFPTLDREAEKDIANGRYVLGRNSSGQVFRI